MAMMFRKILGVVAIALTTTALVACGGGGDAVNTAPTATAGSVNGSAEHSMTFSLADQISDTETPNALTIVVVQTPRNGILTISGTSATYIRNIATGGDDFFTFKVRDPSGAESSTVRQDLIDFVNS